MLTSIKNFVFRHKKKFIFTGVIIGGTMMMTKYAQHKLVEWQEKEATAFLERTRRYHHFESTEQVCNQTIFSLSPKLHEMVLKIFNTDELIEKLINKAQDKVAIWEELKIMAFAKVCVLVYSGAMLVIILRIQLNIIGGYMYCDSMRMADSGLPRISNEIQEKYLSLCQFFLTEGIKNLCTLVESKVRLVLEGRSLKQKISLQDVEQIFWTIQASISSDPDEPIKNFSKLFLPPVDNFEGLMKQVVNDTSELLSSDEVTSLTLSCVSRGFSQIVDRIAEYFVPEENTKAILTPSTSGTNINGMGLPKPMYAFTNPNKVTMPMAKLVPVVSGLVSQGPKKNSNSEQWITTFVYMDKIKALGANVYESFCNPL